LTEPPAHPSDLRASLGHAIWAFVEPHAGHETAFNRWYERDHLIAAGSCAPWTMSVARFVATPALKALRRPRSSPIVDPVERGTHLAALWIQEGRIDEQQAWVAERMKVLAEHDRNFEHRDIVSTAPYDLLGAAERDPDGVPPELALDHRYAGVVLTWLARRGGTTLDALRAWLLEELLPGALPGTPVALSLAFTPRPKPPHWPAAAPEVPGVGERVVLASFVERAPEACPDDVAAGFAPAIEAGGRADVLLAAAFVPVVPGVDPE
jgi:hypothetical protein